MIKKISYIEMKCDRCGVLVKKEDNPEDLESAEQGLVIHMGGNEVLSYDDLCESCKKTIEGIIVRHLGVVKRSGKKLRKKRTIEVKKDSTETKPTKESDDIPVQI